MSEDNPSKREDVKIKKSKSLKIFHKNHPGFFAKENNPNYGKGGVKSKLSKRYLITFPNGKEKIIIGLRQFCREHTELTRMCLIYCSQGKQKQHRGFKCKYI